MKVCLAYGKQGLDVDIPDRNLVAVCRMPESVPLADAQSELHSCLCRPIGAPALSSLAAHARSVCIVVCDVTRPVPNALLLPPVLATLESAGIPREGITILVATGLHRASTPDELREILGDDVPKLYKVVSHDARNSSEHVFLGTTQRGTPVHIDQRYCAADLRVTLGFIEPHFMAGFSGGRKLVAIGCGGEETIKCLHSPIFVEDHRCREGNTDDNALHQELLEIAHLARHEFMIDVALDSSRRITGIFAGDPETAHKVGVGRVRWNVTSFLEERVDIVVTTGGGDPLDRTFYQSVKGVTAAFPAVKEGGTLILAAECGEGFGGPEFARMMTGSTGLSALMAGFRVNPVERDQWQVEELAKVSRHAEVIIVSRELFARYGRVLVVRTASRIEEVLREAIVKHGPTATVAAIPHGPYTLVETGSGRSPGSGSGPAHFAPTTSVS